MARYLTAAEEWQEEFARLHAVPGRRHAKISVAGYRILNMLKPFPWESDGGIGFDAQQVGANRVEISWDPGGDSFVVGHAHGARATGFPEGDARAILAAFRRGGQSRTRPGHPKGRAQRQGILARLSRRNGRRRYRGR